MRFLVAPDKFKGCLKATQVARMIELGILDAWPSAQVKTIPLADGGEGTAEILTKTFQAKTKRTIVHNPLGKKVFVKWGLKGKTAYLDFASAAGFSLVPHAQRNPWKTSSYGVGELLRSATDLGTHKMILGMGGSATVDGGIGMMKALGIRFLDKTGVEIDEGGVGLLQLRKIDLQSCVWNRKSVELMVLTDVMNPLLGPDGAAPIFAPQKGASPSMVRKLAQGFENFEAIVHHQFGKSIGHLPAGGAAGGAIAGLVGILGCLEDVKIRVVQGIDYLLQVCHVEEAMRQSDWIFTGEGQLDLQTLKGKTVYGVASLAQKVHKPVIAFGGKIHLDPRTIQKMGLHAVFSITPKACSMEESLRKAAPWLRTIVRNITTLLRSESCCW